VRSRVKHETLVNGKRRKCLTFIDSKKTGRFENTDCWCPISEDYDHNCSPQKDALCLTTAIMIVFLTKISYWGLRPLTKMLYLWVFIGLRLWSQSSQKCLIF